MSQHPKGEDVKAKERLEPLAVSIPEAARLLSVHEATIYRAMRCGDLMTCSLRGRTLIPMRQLHDIVNGVERRSTRRRKKQVA